MSTRTDVEALAKLTFEELEQRVNSCKYRYQERLDRAQNAQRDLTDREKDLCSDDRQELSALKDALESKRRDAEASEHRALDERNQQHAERVRMAMQGAIDTRARDQRLSPLAVSADNLQQLEQARAEYRSVSVVEHRSALTTTLMGTGVEYAAGGCITPAATEDTLTVFFPGGFKAFATAMASGVVVNPKDGTQTFGQWMLFGLGQSLAGAAVSVDLGGSS